MQIRDLKPGDIFRFAPEEKVDSTFSKLLYRFERLEGSSGLVYYSRDNGKTWSNDVGYKQAPTANRDGIYHFNGTRLVILTAAVAIPRYYGAREDALGFEFLIIGGNDQRVFRLELPDVLREFDEHGWEVINVTEGNVGYTVIGRRYAT